MWNAPVDTVQIEVPHRLFRAMHWRPLALLVAAFTGVSVSFCPLFLYWLGRSGVAITDWRVLTTFAVICLVGTVYISFGAPVLNVAMTRPKDSMSGGRGRSATGELIFWLLLVVIGVVIWVVSDWFVR
jgi:hypothetical protein